MHFFDFHHHQPHKSGIYNLNLNEEIPDFPFSAAVHPKDINDDFEFNFNQIKTISQHENCFAIGECGLDGIIEINEKLQEKIFTQHILWANEIRKPIIIHCVRKFSELLKFYKISKVPLIIHGFNKKKTIAAEMLKNGFYLSFGKAVLQNVSLQQLVKDFPLEKMFLETDDADFDIKILYEKVSELKQIPLENLHSQILKNLNNIRSL